LPETPDPLPFALAALPPALRGGVIAIGNFDGMHRGHQQVLADARRTAEALGRPALMLTFEPHPRRLFQPDRPLFRLSTPETKARIAAALGLDGVVVAPFDRAFASLSADEFVSEVLVGRLGAGAVIVGYDFAYGQRRGGTVETLRAAGRAHGFDVHVQAAFSDEGGGTVGSSRIRELLKAGDVAEAAGLLGYRWFFTAEVVHGDKRGRTIGYPTANMRIDPESAPAEGIYAVILEIDGARHDGVASYGRRPTFDDGAPVFESFVFDFSGDLYGKSIRVTPVAYLRPELKFDGVEALVAQMDRDSAEARALLSGLTPVSPLDGLLLPAGNSSGE
jgi:riboflavin kinase/FMN adenylyltransferase